MTELCLLFWEKSFYNFIKIQIYKRLSNPQYGDESICDSIRNPFKDADSVCLFHIFVIYIVLQLSRDAL